MRTSRWLGLLAAAATLAAGCTAPPNDGTPDAGSSQPDGGSTPPDGGTQVAGPNVGALERIGGYMPARARTVLPGTKTNWIGYIGTTVGGEWMGPLLGTDGQGETVAAGLLGLDQATGQTSLYTDADGLPTMEYGSFEQVQRATVPFFDLAWIDLDKSFVAASWTHLVKASVGTDGKPKTFVSITLKAQGQSVDAAVSTVAVAGGEIFVGTDQGVAVVDPATFAVKRWLDLGVPRGWVYGLSAGESRGAAVAVLFALGESDAPSRVVLARPGQTSTQEVPLPTGARPTSVLGLSGRFLVGAVADKRGEVLSAVAGTGAVGVTTYLAPEKFVKVSTTQRPFWPNRLAYDATRSLLLVGGAISSRVPGASGGLVTFHLDAQGAVDGDLVPAIPREDPYFWFMPWQVETLVVDGLGRWWVAGQQLCDERRMKQTGLYRIEGSDKSRRLVRPLVSGVRDIAFDPVAGNTWLGLRDENMGLTCEGLVVQQAVCQLKADGSCEIYTPNDTGNDNNMAGDVGPARIAFGSNERRELAIATRKNATFVRQGDSAAQVMTQISPGVSLQETAAAWSEGGALWLASEAEWYEAPGDPTDPIDWVKVFDRSPHGVAYLAYAEEVPKEEGMRRYSRNKSDIAAWDVPGMPSNTAWDVLPLAGKRHALAALGIERESRNFDHLLPAPSRLQIKGGIAEIEGDTVRVVAPPAGASFGDVMAFAKGADGTIYALDAALGIVQVDVAAHTSTLVRPAAWKAPVRGLSLAVDVEGHFAVGTSEGLYLYGTDGGASLVSGGPYGWVWSVRFTAPGVLLAGADRGLLRVAFEGKQLPAQKGPVEVQAREPWPLDTGCDGDEGCQCHGDDYCAYGKDCIYITPMEAYCRERPDVCAGELKGESCSCAQTSDCMDGLSCECDGTGACACLEVIDPCGGVAGCACNEDGDCAPGFVCQSGIRGSFCVESAGPPECARNCSCSTTNGCPDGMVCRGGIAGNTCL